MKNPAFKASLSCLTKMLPTVIIDNKPAAAAVTFDFANWNKYSSVLLTPSPELPACGSNKEAARMFVDV